MILKPCIVLFWYADLSQTHAIALFFRYVMYPPKLDIHPVSPKTTHTYVQCHCPVPPETTHTVSLPCTPRNHTYSVSPLYPQKPHIQCHCPVPPETTHTVSLPCTPRNHTYSVTALYPQKPHTPLYPQKPHIQCHCPVPPEIHIQCHYHTSVSETN